jgi:hypothetical protein
MVAVAQLVRAPDCGSGGCGFNPRQPPLTTRRRAAERPRRLGLQAEDGFAKLFLGVSASMRLGV